jgi:tetratricopeptide (TPR) repeat protein
VEKPLSFSGGRYLVRRVLGKGGQKIAYLVHDAGLDRECALSLLERDVLSADDIGRLRHEAQALARLAHPNIVTVHDIGDEDGRPFIVTEFVAGGDLAHAVAGTPLPLARAIEIARDILDALAAIHEHGIVHRDLKPSNVWLDAKGRAKLGDFGLALRADKTRLTAPDIVTGTPAYVSPEQLENGAIDGRADLYAFGCVLFELLTGRTPFTGPVVAVISQHLHAAPPLASRFNPDVPEALDRYLLSLLSKSPEARPRDARDARAKLDEVAALSGVETQRIAPSSSAPISAPTSAPGSTPSASSAPAPSRVGSQPRRLPLGTIIAAAAGAAIAIAAAMLLPGLGKNASGQSMRRVAVLATRESSGTVNATIAWALASRVVEEIDRYDAFRPVNPAGILAARVAVLGSKEAIPDEAQAPEVAKHLGADTIAALSTAAAPDRALTIAIHVFSADDPATGASTARMRLTESDLDGGGPARLGKNVVEALARHWRRPDLASTAKGPAVRQVPFAAYTMYSDAAQYCILGRYDQCELQVRKALAKDPENALFHSLLACALSYQAGKEEEGERAAKRAHELIDQLGSRHDRLLVEGDDLWIEADKALREGDRDRARSVGRRMLDLNRQLTEEWRDPWGYLYAAAGAQYFLGDYPRARASYAAARRFGPSLYGAYFEDAKLLIGDGTNPAQRREAAKLIWAFIECNPTSELVPIARQDAHRWVLEKPAEPTDCAQLTADAIHPPE